MTLFEALPDDITDALYDYCKDDECLNDALLRALRSVLNIDQNKSDKYSHDCIRCDKSKDNLKRLAAVICNNVGIGVSAESILAYCTGVDNTQMYPPADVDDFKRCRNLLSAFPEWKEKLKDIGNKYKNWGTIGEHWSEIDNAYLSEDWKTVNNLLDKYGKEHKEKREK